MNRESLLHEIAIALAVASSESNVDINEFSKVATYARIHLDGAKVFQLLDTIVKDGRYVVRTNRTLDYYRDIRDVCYRHLPDYHNASGEKGHELSAILGWTVRLLRYYRTDAGKAELDERQGAGESQLPSREQQTPVQTLSSHQPLSVRPLPAKTAASPVPVRVETKRESATLITAAKGGKARVRTGQGEEIPCTSLPAYPSPNPGRVFRADVTREGGHAVRAVFKGWEEK